MTMRPRQEIEMQNGRRKLVLLISILLMASPAHATFVQQAGPLPDAQTQSSDAVPPETVYRMFLHLQGSQAEARALKKDDTASDKTLANEAALIGIEPREASAMDEIARAFVAQEKALANEAISYE